MDGPYNGPVYITFIYNLNMEDLVMSITKEELDKYIELYSQGKPTGLTDEEYDRLLEEYLKEHGEENRPFTRQKQTSAINTLVCSLSKAYGVETPMRPGQLTYKEWKQKKGIPDDALIIVQPKLDGGSVACDVTGDKFIYATRGDYDNGESDNVTDVFNYADKQIEQYRDERNFKCIKFEAIMSRHTFDNVFDREYTRPRDAMAAVVHARRHDLAKDYISLMPLRRP